MPLSAGYRLGPYEVLSPLGAGGMGEVYRARDRKLDRDVAIKVLPQSVAADPDTLARFEREAKAVAALSHQNILAIHDFGDQDGIAYAVMELLEGETLRGKLNAGPIPQKQAVDYALQVAKGLSAAHEKGIVHRDLKPENLFVSRDGHLKILDFGLAKRVDAVAPGKETSAPTGSGHTEPGTVMGTAGYMSPEQVKGLPKGERRLHDAHFLPDGRSLLYTVVTKGANDGEIAIDREGARTRLGLGNGASLPACLRQGTSSSHGPRVPTKRSGPSRSRSRRLHRRRTRSGSRRAERTRACRQTTLWCTACAVPTRSSSSGSTAPGRRSARSASRSGPRCGIRLFPRTGDGSR